MCSTLASSMPPRPATLERVRTTADPRVMCGRTCHVRLAPRWGLSRCWRSATAPNAQSGVSGFRRPPCGHAFLANEAHVSGPVGLNPRLLMAGSFRMYEGIRELPWACGRAPGPAVGQLFPDARVLMWHARNPCADFFIRGTFAVMVRETGRHPAGMREAVATGGVWTVAKVIPPHGRALEDGKACVGDKTLTRAAGKSVSVFPAFAGRLVG